MRSDHDIDKTARQIAQRLLLFDHHEFGELVLQGAGQLLGDGRDLLGRGGTRQARVQVDPLGPARHGQRIHADTLQDLTCPPRDLGAFSEARAGPGIEVEDEAFAFTVKRRASKRKASARARRAVDLLREEAELDQRPRVGDDAELFERLRALRKEISTELEMAPYMVFSDKALRGLCRLRPQTRDELIQVNGIGEKKADAFGEQFMAAIEEFESEHARDGA